MHLTSTDPPVPDRTTRERIPRIVGHRRVLPSSRAVVGGLLVTVAMLGTWWASGDHQATPTGRVVVAARSLAAGSRLRADDLRTVAVDLPTALRARTVRDTAELRGTVTTASLTAGDLVQRSAVRPAAGGRGAPARELSFLLETPWAAGGSLAVGDRIDVFVTYGDGADATTTRVLAGAPVLRLTDAGGDGLGATPSQTITVAVRRTTELRATTNAVRAGKVTVVRSTGVGG
jgi:Flp pilus assembly protein CpaB